MPTPPAYQPAKQERSRRTLDALLDAAERLLEKKSFPEISLTELVGAAGVTTGAFYARFRSKDDLLPCLYRRYLFWLEDLIDEQLAPDPWNGMSRPLRTQRAADLICRIFETRGGLLRSMVVFTRLRPEATAAHGAEPADTPPQLLLVRSLCDRLEEALEPQARPPRGELEFGVYSALTLARENILFPGLPMARALALDPRRLRTRLAGLLDFALSATPTDRP